MDIATIDFETYYDQEYSLSRLTTEEYVRSPLFEVIGVSIKINDHETDWFSGTMDETRRFLRSMDFSRRAILCHNTFFDGFILSHHFGICPAFWLDTLSMSRPGYSVVAGGSLHKLTQYFNLGTKGDEVVSAKGKRRLDFTPAELDAYGRYCVNDTELTYKLFQQLRLDIPAAELALIDRTIRMYTEPRIILDRKVLEDHLANVKLQQEQLLNACCGRGMTREGVRKVLNSGPKFAELLRRCGVEPPTKTSLTTGKETFAFAKTDLAFQALLDHPDPRVVTLVEARLGTKSTIEETRTQRLIEVSERGPLPVMLNYYGAHTGRYSGGDKLNLQNLPSRRNNNIRRAICAPEGKVILTCDASQIEARLTAYVAKQTDLVESFRQGNDVYSEFATDIYNYPVDKTLKDERFLGKTCILGLGYGMGPPKFRLTLESGIAGQKMVLPEEEYPRIVRLYRTRYHMISSLWEECDHMLRVMAAGGSGMLRDFLPYDVSGIHLPNGMRLRFTALTQREGKFYYIKDQQSYRRLQQCIKDGSPTDNVGWTSIYGGKVVENIVQTLARIVVFDQLVQISRHYPMVFQVHDENAAVVDETKIAEAKHVVESIMSAPPVWAPDLPVACESAFAANFGDCK